MNNFSSHQTLLEKIKLVLMKTILSNGILLTEANLDPLTINVNLEKTKNSSFGDFSTNFFMTLQIDKEKKMKYANSFVNKLSKKKKIFKSVSIAGPGFINMTLADSFIKTLLSKALSKKDKYGMFKKKKLFYEIEFVSANPTGLMHIGHARNAAYGDILANI
jgi:arginyl-tRNA synthetase